MPSRRVLISNFHPFKGGGHRIFLESLAASSLSQEFELAFATPKSSMLYQRLGEAGHCVFAADFPAKAREGMAVLRAVRRAREIVAEFQPHVVHANGSPDLSVVLWGHLIGRRFRLLRTHHAIKRIKRDPYHAWIYRRAVDANVYVSEHAMAASTENALIPRDPLVIENGVDTERFAPRERDAKLARELGIEPGDFVFGSCAGLGPYKRADIALKAAAELKKTETKPFRLLVLGDPAPGAQLEKLARKLGLENELCYGGFHTDVRPYLSLFDAGFILSDAIETISYATREMLAMGIPVISSSFGGLRENIREGCNGFLVEPGNVDACQQAMARFLKMPSDELATMKSDARQDAVERFGVEKQFAAYRELYGNLADGI